MHNPILNKGQVQLGETTTIVIVIMILLVMGFGFYAYNKAESLKKDQQMLREFAEYQLTLTASNIPELLCITRGSVTENCYDQLKIEALQRLIGGSDKEAMFYYADYFGKSRISVSKIYPSEQDYLIYGGAEGENLTTRTMPIIVYDPINRKNYFGIISVSR